MTYLNLYHQGKEELLGKLYEKLILHGYVGKFVYQSESYDFSELSEAFADIFRFFGRMIYYFFYILGYPMIYTYRKLFARVEKPADNQNQYKNINEKQIV